MLRNLNACLVAVLFALPAVAQNLPLLPIGVQSTGPLRNNYTGFVGMEFTLGLSLEVNALGRAYFTGNTGTHTIKLVNEATGVDVPGATVSVTMSASGTTPYQFVTLPTPVLLQANTPYLLVSGETADGDTWQDLQNVTPQGGYQFFNIGGGVYTDVRNNYVVVPNTAGGAYVPPNLLYSPPSGSPTVVSITSPPSHQQLQPPAIYQFTAVVAGGDAQLPGSVLQFQLDGQNYSSPQSYTSSTSYSIPLDPVTMTTGNHSISAVFTSPGASPVSSASVPFTILQEPFEAIPVGTFNLITAQTPGTIRNNFTGFVGMSFTTNADPLRVRSLGRFVAPGDAQSHIVKLVDASTGVDVPGGSATVVLNSAVAAGQFSFTYLPPTANVVLQPNHTYYLLSQETAGGDPWYDFGPVSTFNFLVNGPVYQVPGSSYQAVPVSGASYVPVSLEYSDTLEKVPPAVIISSPANYSTLSGMATITASAVTYQGVTPPPTIVNYLFQTSLRPGPEVTFASGSSNSATLDTTSLPNGYITLYVTVTDSQGSVSGASATYNIQNTAPPPPTGTPFVTSFQPTFTRNNYSGNVGMQFKVGSIPIQVTSLGRFCVPANAQSHTITLSSGSTSESVTVNMAGCSDYQYRYAQLATPLTLPAGSTYYLYDTEVSGGDAWYDFSPVSTTGVASVIGAVYSNSAGALVTLASPSTSYVPLNFLYTTAAPLDNLTTSITGVTSQGVTATATSNSTVISVQIQVDGYSITPPLTSAPYVQMLPQINGGTHQLTSIAMDSAGTTATSAPFSYLVQLLPAGPPGQPYYAPSLIDFTPGSLRNNYTGWVGFQFTLSSTPISPGVLPNAPVYMGRTCAAGNTQPHYVKIVSAADSTDVAIAWIDCAGVNAGTQLSYAQIVGTLTPGSTYYLVSQETAGGDQFADIGPATPNNCCVTVGYLTPYFSRFTIDGPVYFDGKKYVLVPMPNFSYAGLYFLGLN